VAAYQLELELGPPDPMCVPSDHFGISGTAVNWFQSYLDVRTQSFVYACLATDCFPVTCSVPRVGQGYNAECGKSATGI